MKETDPAIAQIGLARKDHCFRITGKPEVYRPAGL
jgi:hypothetical protein